MDAVIGRLLKGALGQVTPILLAMLLAIAVFAGMLARQYAAERDAAEARATVADNRAEAFGEMLDWQRDRMRLLTDALEQRDQRLAEDRRAIDQQRDAARRLEHDDAETADWAGLPLPDDVQRWVRDLDAGAADASGTGGGDVPSASAPGDATAGAPTDGDAQP
ncbi:hypothetical protein [Halomonas sp. SL1]|uniref:hypothetical protein n=1 Tax=Halomonas sp. SL1 TaxID=2137478 RepID=UPI000D16933C|nr:hypothetical protein [Halomonas sp. SL1]RAH37422.1 hypothetical protein C9J49_011005 [Halomonas sp. SL1]